MGCSRSASWISRARAGTASRGRAAGRPASRRWATVLTWTCSSSFVRAGLMPQAKYALEGAQRGPCRGARRSRRPGRSCGGRSPSMSRVSASSSPRKPKSSAAAPSPVAAEQPQRVEAALRLRVRLGDGVRRAARSWTGAEAPTVTGSCSGGAELPGRAAGELRGRVPRVPAAAAGRCRRRARPPVRAGWRRGGRRPTTAVGGRRPPVRCVPAAGPSMRAARTTWGASRSASSRAARSRSRRGSRSGASSRSSSSSPRTRCSASPAERRASSSSEVTMAARSRVRWSTGSSPGWPRRTRAPSSSPPAETAATQSAPCRTACALGAGRSSASTGRGAGVGELHAAVEDLGRPRRPRRGLRRRAAPARSAGRGRRRPAR